MKFYYDCFTLQSSPVAMLGTTTFVMVGYISISIQLSSGQYVSYIRDCDTWYLFFELLMKLRERAVVTIIYFSSKNCYIDVV